MTDIRPGELSRVSSMFALLGLIIATSYILKPVRSSLFLSQFGAERLPYVYILVAVVLGVVAAGFARWAPRANLPRLFSGAAVFFAANLVMFWLAAVGGWRFTGFVFYVWVSIFTALMPSLFWLLANYVFYSNEGRRLFPVVMAGGLLGSITGGAITSLLVRFVGTPGLLLAASVPLVAIALLIRRNADAEKTRMAERRSELARQEKSRALRAEDSPWRLLTGSRYLSMLAALIVLATTTSTLVDYQFNTVVEQSYDTMDDLTGFFGTFFAAINVLAFVLQLLVVGRLLSGAGVLAGLILLPSALLGSSVLFLFLPQLATAALVKACDDGLSNSANKASVEVLYLPISLAVKNRLKAWLDMFVERVSRGIAGVAILVSTAFFSLATHQVSFIVVGLLIPWIALTWLLRREYTRTFRDSLTRRDISDFTSQLQDPASLALFRQTLESADPRELVYVLELARGVEDPEIVEHAKRLSRHPDAAVRRAALHLLRGTSTPTALDDFPRRVRDVDAGAAADALVLWVEVDPDRGYQALQAIVQEGDVARTDAILDAMEGSSMLERETLVEDFVNSRCRADDADTRRLAAKACGYLPPDSEAAGCLPELLHDDDIGVARAAATSVGRLRYEPAFALLIEALRRRPLRVALRSAIARFGPDTIDELGARYRSDHEPFDVRTALPLVLAEFDDPRAVSALFASMPQADRKLHYQGVKGLGKLRSRYPDLRFSRGEVDRLVKGEASLLAALASLRFGVDSVAPAIASHRLLLRVLDERLDFTRERIFRLLGLVYPQDAVFSAHDRIVNGRPAVRASALEYLSNVFSKRHRTWLYPLLEADDWSEVQRRSRLLFGTTRLRFDEALARLVRHPDPWLAATAVTVVGEIDGSPVRAELSRLREHPAALVREAVEGALQP